MWYCKGKIIQTIYDIIITYFKEYKKYSFNLTLVYLNIFEIIEKYNYLFLFCCKRDMWSPKETGSYITTRFIDIRSYA